MSTENDVKEVTRVLKDVQDDYEKISDMLFEGTKNGAHAANIALFNEALGELANIKKRTNKAHAEMARLLGFLIDGERQFLEN